MCGLILIIYIYLHRTKDASVKQKASLESHQLSSEFFQSAVELTMKPSEPEKQKSSPEGQKIITKILSSPVLSPDKSPSQGQSEDVTPSTSSPSISKFGTHSQIITKFTKKVGFMY